MSALVCGSRIVEVFRDLVREGSAQVGATHSEDSEHYLVRLLVDHAQAPLDDAPAGLRLFAGLGAGDPCDRNGALRRAGDEALFLSGVAPDSLARSPVDVDYYHRVGRMAYGALSARLGRRPAARLYREMTEKFVVFADILWEVARKGGLAADPTPLRLHERILRTGSTHLRRILARRGQPQPPASLRLALQ